MPNKTSPFNPFDYMDTQDEINNFLRDHARSFIYTRYQSRCIIQSLARTSRQGVT